MGCAQKYRYTTNFLWKKHFTNIWLKSFWYLKFLKSLVSKKTFVKVIRFWIMREMNTNFTYVIFPYFFINHLKINFFLRFLEQLPSKNLMTWYTKSFRVKTNCFDRRLEIRLSIWHTSWHHFYSLDNCWIIYNIFNSAILTSLIYKIIYVWCASWIWCNFYLIFFY